MSRREDLDDVVAIGLAREVRSAKVIQLSNYQPPRRGSAISGALFAIGVEVAFVAGGMVAWWCLR